MSAAALMRETHKSACIFQHQTIKSTSKRRRMTQTQRNGTHDSLDVFFFFSFFLPAGERGGKSDGDK